MSKTTNLSRYARYKYYAKGVIYHIYNRAVEGQEIFLEDTDYKFYLNRLKISLQKHNISLLCYVLMSNHMHLVVKQETDSPVYRLISSLHTSYSMYFNKKYNRTGHLFQDRFKQVIVESDEQFLHLTRYIHQNPVKAGMVKSPEAYLWTSYHEFVRTIPNALCRKDLIAGLLTSQKSLFSKTYAAFCQEKESDEQTEETLKEIAIEPF